MLVSMTKCMWWPWWAYSEVQWPYRAFASNTMTVSVVNKIWSMHQMQSLSVSSTKYGDVSWARYRMNTTRMYTDHNEHILKSSDRIVLSLEIQWSSRMNVSGACILLEGREIVCVRTWKWCRKRGVWWRQGEICPSFLFPVTYILGENINIHNAEQIFMDAPCN